MIDTDSRLELREDRTCSAREAGGNAQAGTYRASQDVVALEDRPRLVPADPPGHPLRDAGPDQVANSRPPEVVEVGPGRPSAQSSRGWQNRPTLKPKP